MTDMRGSPLGAGYSYRLCPATEELTEACFQQHPLDFNQDKQAILFPNGTSVAIQGVFIDEGTTPKGSQWVRCTKHAWYQACMGA